MKTVIVFATESGNAQYAADQLADDLEKLCPVEVVDAYDFRVAQFDPSVFYLFIVSTYEEGVLPYDAELFYREITEAEPDLSGVRFGLFGLGDSSYFDYCIAVDILDERFTKLGAKRIGEIDRHDAIKRTRLNEQVRTWGKQFVDFVIE